MKSKIKSKSKTKTGGIAVAPVKKYAPPEYPTLADAQREPALLRRLPPRWEKNARVAAAAGLLGAITLTSCGIFKSSDTGYNPESANFLNVAPIFAYGEGTGAIGCDMVAPPVFLSEQEALAIIKNEAESNGLKFNAAPPGYVATDNKPKEISQYSWDNPKYLLGGGEIGLDLYDSEKSVAVAYIPMESAGEVYPDPDGARSSVEIFRPRELAELAAGDFAKQKGDIAVGIFYDPGQDWGSDEQTRLVAGLYETKGDWSEKLAQYESEAKILAEENLRAQIRDFIEWLQAQGII